MKFINRINELSLVDEVVAQGGMTVFMGRRRIGKTRLIKEWSLRKKSQTVLYSQAIESNPHIQLAQIWGDIKHGLPLDIEPQSWEDLFKLFSLLKKPTTIVIDEFPFLTQSDPSLPSRFQKWIDHDLPENITLFFLGSSQTLMQAIFLDGKAPLYERAYRIIKIKPLSYKHFCKHFKLDPLKKDSFSKFSLVGGIPKYWEKMQPEWKLIQMADNLYFKDQAFFENEKLQILKDENIDKIGTLSVLDAIGRGASKPSDISKVLQIKQTSLSKIFSTLIETGLILREIPFGDSTRNSKKTIYTIVDPFLAFYFNIFSPHRTRWDIYSEEEKRKLIDDHASKVFETSFRESYPSSSRYYEGHIEIDSIHFVAKDRIQVSELKYRTLSAQERKTILQETQKKFANSKIGKKWKTEDVDIKVIDRKDGLALISQV